MLPLGRSLIDEPADQRHQCRLSMDCRRDCHARRARRNQCAGAVALAGERPAQGPRQAKGCSAHHWRQRPAEAARASRVRSQASDRRPRSSTANCTGTSAIDAAGASSTRSRKARRPARPHAARPKIADQSLGLGPRTGHGIGVEQPRDLAALREIAVLVARLMPRLGIAAPAVEEVDRARDMHPGEQPRIGRRDNRSRPEACRSTCSWIALTLAIAASALSRWP